MSTLNKYQIPIDDAGLRVAGSGDARFTWEYDDPREGLQRLYTKGKQLQWDAATRIDWSIELDPENPQLLDDRMMPLAGSALWDRLNRKEKAHLRLHQQAHSLSQFLHGEQGAMLMAARLVNLVPDMDAKLYAATQVMDEARHVEVYARLLHEKFGIVYPATKGLRLLFDILLSDSRWDVVYLGTQVLLEGVALAVFQRMRDFAANPLAQAVNAFVMQDEARHVAFGRMALRGYYPQLTQAERDEREEFIIETLHHIRERLDQSDLWQHLGFSAQETREAVQQSESAQMFRVAMFSRLVPTVKDIGLWGSKLRKYFTDLGVMEYQAVNLDAISAKDEAIAARFDARNQMKQP